MFTSMEFVAFRVQLPKVSNMFILKPCILTTHDLHAASTVARHVYRYHYIFDGDSRIDAGQKYSAATV